MFTAQKPSRLSRVIASWIVISHLTSFAAPAFANPGGGSVTAGSANISSSGAITSIHQSTDRAVINWQTFSNAAGETVNFQQPSASSITLNRVSGASRSQIDGALNANGRVFLLNPNGVVFGKTANVKVNGLVTSTLDMDDDAGFMAGRNSHSLSQNPARPQASVINQGRIEAGSGGVAFVAPIVNNQGHIVAALGQVSLAGTTKAVVNYDQQGLVNVAIPSGKGGRGDVTVPQGADSELLMDAATAPGVVEAGAITRTADGRIILKNAEGLALNEGTIVARGAGGSGGIVRVHGTQGSILGKASLIDASAVVRGNGGDVRVTSGGTAITMKGSKIVARGGDEGGDGGYVDISAPHFVIKGTVDVRAPQGKTGTILLDPNDIEIVDDGSQDSDADVADNTINAGDVTTGDPAKISVATLETLTGNILLEANNTIIVRDITSDNSLDLQAGASLTLRTISGDITFDNLANQIVATGGGNIAVDAGGAATLGVFSATGGTVSVIGGTGIQTAAITADNLNLTTSASASQTGVYTVTGTTTFAGGLPGTGSFDLSTQANALGTVASTGSVNSVSVRSDAGLTISSLNAATQITLISDGAVSVTTALTTDNLQLASVTAGSGDFTLATGVDVNSLSTSSQVNTVSIVDATGFATGALDTATSITIDSDGAITQTGAITTPTLNLASAAGTGSFTLDQANDVDTLVTTTAMNDLTFRDDDGFAITPGGAFTASLTLLSSNAVNQTAAISTPLLSLSTAGAAQGTFNFDTQANTVGAVQTLTQIDTVLFRNDASFSVGGLSAAGAVTLQSDGTVTQTGAITTNTLTLTASTAGSGVFQLAGLNNDVNNLVATNQLDTLQFRDDGGFDVALAAAGVATSLLLDSNGTVTQSASIAAPSVVLRGSGGAAGDFQLGDAGNEIVAISSASQIGSALIRDDTGFDVAGLSATGTLELVSDGTVTQTGAIAAGTLRLTAANAGNGTFTLDTLSNAVVSVETSNQVATLAFRADAGFSTNAISAATLVRLQSDGTVSQTAGITAAQVRVTATTPGSGNFDLSDSNNDATSFATTNQVGDVFWRDDNGFVVNASATGRVALQSNGTVTQDGVITADLLAIAGALVGTGTFQLNTFDNAVNTITAPSQFQMLTFQDNTGFVVDGLSAATSIAFQSDGTVTQTGAITTPNLLLTATTAGQGSFQLNGVNNDAALTVTGQVQDLAYRDDNGFGVTGINAVNSVTLQSNGNVTQSGVITTANLTVGATTNGSGNFDLSTQNNDVDTLSGGTRFFSLNFRDDDGFSLGALTVATDATLISNSITQTGALTALQAFLTASTAGTANFTLNGANNNVQTLVATNQVNTLAFRDDSGFTLALPAGAVTSVTLQSNSTVNASSAFTTPLLTLTATTDGQGTFNFGGSSNTIGTLTSTNTIGSVTLRDDASIDLGLFAATNAALVSNGTISQTGTVTAANLSLTAQAAGNLDVNLTTQNNGFGTVLTGNTVNTLALRDDGGFAVGAVTADTSITLRSNGAVTQSGVITTPLLSLTATASGSGDFQLDTQNNVLGTVTSTNTLNTVALRADAGFVLGALTADTSIALTGGGANITQTGVLDAPALFLTGQGAGGGLFRLGTQNNAIGTISTTNRINVLEVRDSAGLTFGAFDATALDVNTDGTLNQTAPMIATSLTLRSSADGLGDVVLDAANQLGVVDTLNVLNSIVLGSTGTMQLMTLEADTRVTLASTGVVQEVGTAGITAPSLQLTGTGTFVLDRGNDVTTLAANVNGGSITFNDVNDVALGTVASTGLQTGGGNLTLTAQSIAMNESVDLATGNGVLAATAGITSAAGKSFAANALALNGGAGNAIGSAGARFNTNVNSLSVTDSTGNGAGASSLFLNEINDLTLTAIVGTTVDAIVGGALTLSRVTAGTSATVLASGNIALDTLTTGTYDLRSGGSVSDTNGAATNITSSGAGRISATGAASTLGTVTDPIEVTQTGTLTVNIPGQVGGVSGAFAGTLAGGRGGLIIEQAPGIVFFNGFPVNISVFQLVTTALGQGAAGAILSASGQLQDLVEVAADNIDELQSDDSEAQKKRAAKKAKDAKDAQDAKGAKAQPGGAAARGRAQTAGVARTPLALAQAGAGRVETRAGAPRVQVQAGTAGVTQAGTAGVTRAQAQLARPTAAPVVRATASKTAKSAKAQVAAEAAQAAVKAEARARVNALTRVRVSMRGE